MGVLTHQSNQQGLAFFTVLLQQQAKQSLLRNLPTCGKR